MNNSVLHNLNEIKENAIQAHNAPFADIEADLNGPNIFKNTGGGEKIVQDLLKNLLRSISESVELTGFIDPMNKVYLLNKPLEHLPMLFALLTIYSYE